MKRFLTVFLAVFLARSAFAQENRPIGAIDFFGQKGLDVEAVRRALPIHEGDLTSSREELKKSESEAVKKTLGRDPTDVATVCCDDRQRVLIYIGLPGQSSKPVKFNPTPKGAIRLPADVMQLSHEIDQALMAAILKGASREDDSQGYALSEEATSKAKQLELREYALRNEATILQVLKSSSDAGHRAFAAEALGYGRQSDTQIAALVSASLDPDGNVRDNAVRALGVMARAKPEIARKISAAPFIQLLASGTWTDRNKAILALEPLTSARNPDVLKQLRDSAIDQLIEVARWHNLGHAWAGRMVLGRIAGIEEKRLLELAGTG